jgi:hypothetical protein
MPEPTMTTNMVVLPRISSLMRSTYRTALLLDAQRQWISHPHAGPLVSSKYQGKKISLRVTVVRQLQMSAAALGTVHA